MRVQPAAALARANISIRVGRDAAPQLTAVRAVPSSPSSQLPTGQTRTPILPPVSDAMPVGHETRLWEQELFRICNTYHLQIEDRRDRNGNLWVVTDDTDEYVNSQLRSWGFQFKMGKGWWQK
jgi:hypothetical protein